jgi:SAM-dependent methyltransferase
MEMPEKPRMLTDHFSTQSAAYRQFRPGYPRELYAFLAAHCAAHRLAWDAGTGNGQAAVALAAHFERVIATDPSAEQLANAEPHARVEYRPAAENCDAITAGNVDLVTAAQAVHWFDFERFYAEVRRVLRPDGLIAVWTHNLPLLSAEVDAIVRDFHTNIVGPYWPPQRRHVDEEYRNIPFPFAAIDTPKFVHEEHWSAEQFLGYLSTWSSVKYYLERRGADPLALIDDALRRCWPAGSGECVVRLPVTLRAGRV